MAAAIARVQAEALEKVVGQGLPSSIVLERVVIRETPTCAAEISHDA